MVPPEQSVRMHGAVKARGLPTALVMLQVSPDGCTRVHATVDGPYIRVHTHER